MSAELEKGLYSILSASSPPLSVGTRIYPRLPQNVTFPAIRYQRITTSRTLALDAAVGVTEATVQVDCMADTYADAKALADAVRVVLHAYRGAWGNLKARLVKLQTENDFYDQDGDKVTHWVTQRYQVWTDMD